MHPESSGVLCAMISAPTDTYWRDHVGSSLDTTTTVDTCPTGKSTTAQVLPHTDHPQRSTAPPAFLGRTPSISHVPLYHQMLSCQAFRFSQLLVATGRRAP